MWAYPKHSGPCLGVLMAGVSVLGYEYTQILKYQS